MSLLRHKRQGTPAMALAVFLSSKRRRKCQDQGKHHPDAMTPGTDLPSIVKQHHGTPLGFADRTAHQRAFDRRHGPA